MYIEDINWHRLFKSGGKSFIGKPLTVSENGTYTAPQGQGYTPVYVDVGGTGTWSDVVGLAIVGRSIVGYEGNGTLVGDAIVGAAIIEEDDGGSKPFDQLTWDQVIASTKTGKYKSFNVGDMKELDLGTEGIVHMQIVGIDVDELADGSGKAPLTFISKELLKTSHRMNPARTPSSAPYDEGTGTIGGWEKCEMRGYLKNTIKPLIPENVQNAIVDVTKYSNIFDSAGTKVRNVATAEDVWIPSTRESGATFADAEREGPLYSIFSSNDSRIKTVDGEPKIWFLRSVSVLASFGGVNKTGGNGMAYTPTYSGFVALGFCL